jgi:hypothetical protein
MLCPTAHSSVPAADRNPVVTQARAKAKGQTDKKTVKKLEQKRAGTTNKSAEHNKVHNHSKRTCF